MTRRDLERRLSDLKQTSVNPPAWFLKWSRNRSDEWIRKEWKTIVREAEATGRSPEVQAWVRGLTEDDPA